MHFCLVTFPPSKGLKKFLQNYIEDTQVQGIPEVKEIAVRCGEKLPRITLMGQRKQVPSKYELEQLEKGQKVSIDIRIIENGEEKRDMKKEQKSTNSPLQVDSFELVADVERKICQKLKLVMIAPFALYEAFSAEENQETILSRRDRILDVKGAWESDDLNETQDESKSFKKAATKLAKTVEKKYDTLLFKAKLVVKTSCRELMRDEEALDLVYQQAVHDIISGRYPPGKASDPDVQGEVIRVAAFQLQATHRDYDAKTCTDKWFQDRLHKVVPESYKDFNPRKGRAQQEVNDWVQKIKDRYQRVLGLSQLEAKVMYLTTVQDWQYYGMHFFKVGQRCYPDQPPELDIGVNYNGVIVVHPENKTPLKSFPYTEIVQWGHAAEKFVLVTGNAIQQFKLILKTKQGEKMSNLIHSYIKFILKQQEAEGRKS